MAKLHIKRIEGFGALTKRWLFRSAVLTVAIFLVICFVCGFFVRNYYYDTVYNKLRSYSSGTVTNYFNSYTTDAEFAAGAVDFVSEFSEKSSAEVWVIDKSGKVIVSSSGFGISYPEMPDYYEALDSKDESLFTSWEGKIESGEKIMAVTTLIKEDRKSVV